jgi:hypothetical protein
MKYTAMYIATRWLRTKNLIHHIIILQEPSDIDMMQPCSVGKISFAHAGEAQG